MLFVGLELPVVVVTVTPPLVTLYCLEGPVVLDVTIGDLELMGLDSKFICWLELNRVILLCKPPTDPTLLPPTLSLVILRCGAELSNLIVDLGLVTVERLVSFDFSCSLIA